MIEEKLVSFRIAKLSNSKAKNQLNHNIRLGWQPKYIKTELSQNNYTIFGTKDLDLDEIKREQNKRSKRKIQKNSSRFLSGIMTFSKSMKEDYEKEIFDVCSKDFLKKIEAQLNLKILQAEVHLDETTPHIHIIFDNLDENGKTINRTINPEMLSNAQDELGESFSKMSYKRGRKGSENTHMSVRELHQIDELKAIALKELERVKDDAKQIKEDSKDLMSIFDKLVSNNRLDENEKEILETIAPSLFQFLEKSDIKKKQNISNKITQALKPL